MNQTNFRNSLKNIPQRIQGDQHGQAMMEFAFAFIILISITLGIVDFGRAMYAKSAIDAASQEGVRRAIVTMQNSGVDVASTEAAVRDRMFGLDTSSASIDVTQSGPKMVDVTVTYDFRFVTPFIGSVLGGNNGMIQLVSVASMLAQ